MSTPIELYYWPTPNGWKISIALEEFGLPYNPNLIDINAGDQHRPEYLKISPNGRIPAIIDPGGPDGRAVPVFESGAILQYLARKTGRFTGSTERERVAVEEWLMWQMGGVGPMAGQAHHFLFHVRGSKPDLDTTYSQDRYRGEVARLYSVLDRRLAEHEYVAGDFISIADFAIWPWASQWRRQEQVLDDKPDFRRWLHQLGRRPGVRRGRMLEAHRRPETGADIAHRSELFGQTTDRDQTD